MGSDRQLHPHIRGIPLGGEQMPCTAGLMLRTGDDLIRLASDMKRGEPHLDTPLLLTVYSTVAEETRTSSSGHTMKCITFMPYDLKDGGPEKWDEIKEGVEWHSSVRKASTWRQKGCYGLKRE